MLLTPALNVCLLVMLHLLLLQSGDVESNPGPFGEKSECKLATVLYKWDNCVCVFFSISIEESDGCSIIIVWYVYTLCINY